MGKGNVEVDRPTAAELATVPEGRNVAIDICPGCGSIRLLFYDEKKKLAYHAHINPHRWLDMVDEAGDKLEAHFGVRMKAH